MDAMDYQRLHFELEIQEKKEKYGEWHDDDLVQFACKTIPKEEKKKVKQNQAGLNKAKLQKESHQQLFFERSTISKKLIKNDKTSIQDPTKNYS